MQCVAGCTGLPKSASLRQTQPTIEYDTRDWPADTASYELLEQCGKGGNATVYKALCLPFDEIVAIKVLDLDSGDVNQLAAVAREAQLMRRYAHPNVLRLHTSLVAGAALWMVMPYLAVGSARAIMKRDFPEGLSEVVLATIMREALKGLAYVHAQGGIHRDIKADNILLGQDGSVLLADFGVAAVSRRAVSLVNLAAGATSSGRASTVIGTPCWMAPEVLADADGYDSSADIWSFGITLLELAQGRVPQARQHPMRVMMATLAGPAPCLEDDPTKGRVYSKALKQVVTLCLQKDASSRIKAAELLGHKFFRQARDKSYLVTHFLSGLTPATSPRVAPPAAAAAAGAPPGGWRRGSAMRAGGGAAGGGEGVLRGASVLMQRLKSTWYFPPTTTRSSSQASSTCASPTPSATAPAGAAAGGSTLGWTPHKAGSLPSTPRSTCVGPAGEAETTAAAAALPSTGSAGDMEGASGADRAQPGAAGDVAAAGDANGSSSGQGAAGPAAAGDSQAASSHPTAAAAHSSSSSSSSSAGGVLPRATPGTDGAAEGLPLQSEQQQQQQQQQQGEEQGRRQQQEGGDPEGARCLGGSNIDTISVGSSSCAAQVCVILPHQQLQHKAAPGAGTGGAAIAP